RGTISLSRVSPRSRVKNHDHHTSDIPADQVSSVKQESQITTQTTTSVSPTMSLLSSDISELAERLPFKLVGGFVIFFDFIYDMKPSTELCKLVICLHHPKSGLGEPSQLQSFRCNSFVDQNGQKTNVALIATKQPVPRCSPEQALTIVIEVQTANYPSYYTQLQTTSWAKIPLFDRNNRLLNGRWKVPMRSLPMQCDASLAIINTLPTDGTMELHYRLVDTNDAEEQTKAPLSPTCKDLYVYMIPVRRTVSIVSARAQ
ncbi:unnamed protein product, partial [Didymodactylos carnosus]